MLVFTAWHDNTAANRTTRIPSNGSAGGDRTVDEMAHAWVDVTYLEPAEFDQMVAERKAKKARGEENRRAATAIAASHGIQRITRKRHGLLRAR